VVQRPKKRESAAPQAQVALDDRGLALSTLLGSALDDVDVQIDAAVDEVVVVLSPDDLLAVCRIARESDDLDFNYLRCVSVVDYEERLEVNYHLFSLAKRHKMVIKTSVSPEAPNVPTVTGVWRAADWFEREGHDLFGVVFAGHPDLAPLLLYEGFEGFPGRKSFPFHDYDEW
jgi:NADH-quinone oxidoreductase subunit C